ncbi:MAG: glycosyltransferase family 39 protein [Candidatus Omnitrophica bacterium]|nr:glycosyltransferase family 39 protein [Candidatus Omnitrophota bacterium]
MLKRKNIKLGLELIFILALIFGGVKVLDKKINLPVYDSDEVSWIFTAYYFNLYFLRLELFHPDWNDYEAFDQPPLGKYIIGAALHLKGYTIDSLEPKMFLNSIPLTKLQKGLDLVIPKVPNPRVVIPLLRSVIFIFALSSLLLIYISLRISYGFLPALISTGLIVSNPIFGMVSTRILGDPILLLFFALFILFCTLYLKSKNTIYIILAFIVSSLAFSTKLNGILLVPMLIVLFLVKNKFSLSRPNVKVLITGLTFFLLVTVILNPVYLNSGIRAIARMADARFSAFQNYQETFKHAALSSVSERFVAAAQIIFFQNSLFYKFVRIPLELIIFVLGIYNIFRKRDLFLMLIFLFLVIIPVSILPFRLSRYCYWIFPFTHIMAGQSLNFFRDLFTRARWLRVRPCGDDISNNAQA